MNDINVSELIGQHKNKVINASIFIVALLFAYNIYNQQIKERDLLIEKRDTETKKNAVLEDIRILEKKIQVYKGFLNRKDISVVMNTMSEMAKQFSINVISIRPERQLEESLYIRYYFALKLEFDSYHALGNFISQLESRPELYSVEKLGMLPVYSFDNKNRKLNAELTVSTVLIKD